MASKGLEARLQRLDERSKGVSQRAYARRLRELLAHLKAARGQPSPSLALHKSGARTGLFQLECLGRLHRETIDDEGFAGVHAAFKSLEDLLGSVDFNDALYRKLSEANGDSELRAFFAGRRAEACARADHALADDGWWSESESAPSEAVESVLDALEDADWPGPRKEKKLVKEYFTESAEELQDKLDAGEFDLAKLEEGVHEVRRRVRWLSILPASLDGLFVRPEHGRVDKKLQPYCTEAVVKSPFNAFPKRPEIEDPIVLHSPSFLATSWLIQELGALKDRGQTGDALSAAARDLDDGPKAAAARVRKVLGDAPPTHEALGAAASEIVARFVRDGVLSVLATSTR